jgi:transposase
VYVDESGIDTYAYRPWARAPRGKIIYGKISGKRYERESFIAAKTREQIIAPFCFKGTCDTKLFNLWVEKSLVPLLRKGQVIIMDNATFHKSKKTRELIENAECKLLFLPPYSPDFNPIEKTWANLKRIISNTISEFTSLSEAINYAFCGLN